MIVNEQQFEQIWMQLETAINGIQKKQNSTDLSFVDLYRNTYDVVVSKRSNVAYDNVKKTIAEHLQNNISKKILSAFNNKLHLMVINKEWADHQIAMAMIRDILMYLDRMYVEPSDLENIYNLGIILFREKVIRFPAVKEGLRSTMLRMIAEERTGGVTNRIDIRNTCEMLITLGMDSLDVYVNDFETSFLGESAQFFEMEYQKYKKENSAAVFLQMAQKRLQEEIDRAKNLLHGTTIPKITKVIEDSLVKNHMQEIIEMGNKGVVQLIVDMKVDELATLFQLFKKYEGGEAIVFETFRTTLQDLAANIYKEKEHTGKLTNAILVTVSVAIIEEMLALKDNFDRCLHSIFQNNGIYADKFDKEFKKILQDHALNPEYLNLYIDHLIKAAEKQLSDDEFDAKMDKVMGLFKLMTNIDKFEEHYRRSLSRRLLADKAIDSDIEKNVVTRIKSQCGPQFTVNLEEMFKDMELSDETQRKFRAQTSFAQNNMPFDLRVKVLKSAAWPNSIENHNVFIPPTISNSFDKYLAFYIQSNPNRKLQLNLELGTAELKMMFYGGSNEPIRTQLVNTPTYSMLALLLFNEHAQLTFQAIQAATNITEGVLKRYIALLVWGKAKILIKEPMSNDKKEILATDIFTINEDFKSKMHKVTIKVGEARKEPSVELAEMDQIVAKRREFEIEACIVRIMKARQRMKHNDLMLEVVDQLIHRFIPEPAKVKGCISKLIEKEYVARAPDMIDVYTYVA